MDVLNVAAILAVIFLHTSQTVFNYRADNRWLISVFTQILFIWAVPIFFMLSGANLLNYDQRYSTKIFLKKRFFRVVVPFIFWSIVWYLYNTIVQRQDLSIVHFLNDFMYGKIAPSFWFFYDIIAFYLAVPFLAKLFIVANKNRVEYLIFLMISIQAVVMYLLGMSVL